MQINALCPKCQNRYQFDSALIGQRIRCTNKECREVFEVREAAVKEAPVRAKNAPRDRRAPTFENDVEEVAPPRVESQREADWSKMPPPPLRQPSTSRPIEEPSAVSEDRASADEVLAFMGLAPQAVGDDFTLPAEAEVVEEVYEVTEADDAGTDYDSYMHGYHRPKRRWIPVAIVGMLILIVVGMIAGLVVYKQSHKRRETELAKEANELIGGKKYRQAAQQFDDLLKGYPSSKDLSKYRLLRDFCRAMESATNPSDEATKRLNDFTTYLISFDKSEDPNKSAVTERQDEIRNALIRIAEDQIRDAKKHLAGADKDFVSARRDYKKAIETQVYINRYSPPNIQPAIPAELSKEYAKLNEAIEEGEKYRDFIAKLDGDLAKELNPAKLTVLKTNANRLGYGSKPEVIERFKSAEAKIRTRIVFVAADVPPKSEPVSGLVSLLIGTNADAKIDDNKVVFAASRGVLYALSQSRGKILWATRIGIDSAGLPLRIPAAGRTPETVLAPTPNGQGLIAREAFTGKFVWHQELPFPIRGQPIYMERRLYVPLTDDNGTVVVMESNDGSIRGQISVGQRLGPGAARQESSGLIFLPADSQNVYVLDTRQEQPLVMVAMLATNHGPGSLRGEPVVVGGVDDAGQAVGISYLILPVSDGFNAMKLRSFEIPGKLDQTSVAIPSKEVPLPGWSWFPPVCDQEKIAVVTDAGAFALLGINQKDNQDPAMFPLIMEQPKEGTAREGRGLVVHAEENDFWYIAHGELIYETMGFDRKEGRRLALRWPAPLKLGTPLHAAQVSDDRKTLFVVTQTTSPPAWLATAVDARSGEIRWQQALGLAVQGDPFQLGDLIYQIDQGGGLYVIDPKKTELPKGQAWPLGGHVILRPRNDVVGEPVLLQAGDGKTAYLVYAVGDGKTLHAIRLIAGQRPEEPAAVRLSASLAGKPVLSGSTLIMALADGALHRWKIGDKDTKRGSDWRAPRFGESARAYLTTFRKNDILVSDGYRGLTVYNWPDNAEMQFKQQLSVPDRIIAALVAIPVKEGAPRIAVADAGGRLNLLEGDPLAPTMKWEMRSMRQGNEITAGPFLIDDKGQPRFLIVVDRNRLVCLNPDERREAWFHRCPGDGIDAMPRAIGDSLVLADLSGRFEAIETASGRPVGHVYPAQNTLPAAPAAAPVEFGANFLFAPLTDGTVLIIPRESLLPKK